MFGRTANLGKFADKQNPPLIRVRTAQKINPVSYPTGRPQVDPEHILITTIIIIIIASLALAGIIIWDIITTNVVTLMVLGAGALILLMQVKNK